MYLALHGQEKPKAYQVKNLVQNGITPSESFQIKQKKISMLTNFLYFFQQAEEQACYEVVLLLEQCYAKAPAMTKRRAAAAIPPPLVALPSSCDSA